MNKIFEKGILTGKVCLILIGLLFTIRPVNAQIVEYAIMRDVSNSSIDAQPLNSDIIFRKVVGELGLQDAKKGVNLHILLCGASRLPEVRLATLPLQEGWLSSSSERTKHLRQFLTKAKADIKFLAEHPADQPQTNLYRALVHLSKQFSKESTEKKIIVISDGAEVSSVINANQYYQQPSDLITDFDKIIEQFQKDSPLPDLTGVEVVLVTPGSTDFHLWLSRFWVKFVQMQGGSATVRATF